MGELLTPVPTTPNDVTDSWQPLVESNVMSSYGMNVVTLTEWSASTIIPSIAQGSAIDIDGSTARFVTTEAIGGAPANGTVYVKFIVSGSTVTAELTATAPTWDNTKGGWYNGSGERYSGHMMVKNGTAYTLKALLPQNNSTQTVESGGGGLLTKLLAVTRDATTSQFFSHGIPNGNDRIMGISSFAYISLNNAWNDISALTQDTSHRQIYITFNDTVINIVDLDSDTINKPIRFLITYTAI